MQQLELIVIKESSILETWKQRIFVVLWLKRTIINTKV